MTRDIDPMTANSETAASEAQKRLIGSVVTQKPAGFLSRLFTRGAVKAIIGDKQERCCVVSVMVLVDKTIPLDGMIMAIGTGGATFRPASAYILDRGRAEVLLRFADREMRGKIQAVSPLGYDIAFQQSLAPSAVQDIVVQFGMGSVSSTQAAIGRLS
jgi:hypothetical protein